MLKFIGKMLKLAGPYAGKLKLSFVLSFFEALFANVPVFAVLFVFMKGFQGALTTGDCWLCFFMIAGSLVIRWALRRAFYGLESGTGYEICARERIALGDRFKRFPMSYFTEGNLGNVTSAIATDLLFIEEHGMMAMDKVINGYATLLIGCAMQLFIDWRVGLVAIATSLAALFLLGKLQTVGKEQSKIKMAQSAKLTAAVLEYVQGISVIKALHMVGDKAQSIKREIKDTRDHAVGYEQEYTPPSTRFQLSFAVGIALGAMVLTSLALYGQITLSVMIMMLVYLFYMYRPAQALGGLAAQVRVMEAGFERYDAIKRERIIDADGKDIKLSRFDVEFDHVGFSYEEKETLKDISFKAKERSMTALVGASGSGKSTIANLIVRFWDVQQGAVMVGGVDVKRMSCDSLLKNISMVFQKVYLFEDTVAQNIRFGRPNATDHEVIEAAKKARCHEFIMQLPNGYDTVLGEGGATLSSGEKQRVSIARAILKDSPIVLLDEATASVDPDNERHIQQAIDELVKDKTLIVIAHRLSTIQRADQILVIDEGSLVQRGIHVELIDQDGPYAHLWQKRNAARGWKIAG